MRPMSLHLHLDPFSGIAGDMFLGALIDLADHLTPEARRLEGTAKADDAVNAVNAEAVVAAVNAALVPLGLTPGFELRVQRTQRRGLSGIDLKVVVPGDGEHRHEPAHQHSHDREHASQHNHGHHHNHGHGHGHGHDHEHEHNHGHAHHHDHGHHHHHVHYPDMLALIEKLDTAPRARERAGRVVRVLAEAEAKAHGIAIEKVHFHEVGATDSIVDMLGGCVALEALGIDTLSCGVLPISSGYVRCDHGLMPVPAPATLNILAAHGLPTVGVDRRGELITPTGAALAAGLCERFGPPPPLKLIANGWGAGDRDDPDVPNMLRVVLGHPLTPGDLAATQPQPTH